MLVYAFNTISGWNKFSYNYDLSVMCHSYEYLINNIFTKQVELMDDLPLTIKESKSTDILYVKELNKFYKNIIELLKSEGYTPHNTKNLLSLKSGEFTYLITKHLGAADNCYYIRLKKNSKTIIHIYNIDNIITSNENNVVEDFGYNTGNIAFAYNNAITLLNDKVKAITHKDQKIYPFTLNQYAKKILNKICYRKNFTNLCEKDNENKDLLHYINNTYHGGFCYIKTPEKIYEDVTVYDKNSMYPDIMKNRALPYGEPMYCRGKPLSFEFSDAKNEKICLFLRIVVNISLKDDGVPCIQKNKYMIHEGNMTESDIDLYLNEPETDGTYILHTNNKPIELTLTYMDYLLLIDNYNINGYIEYIDYIKFTASKGDLFGRYIDLFYKEKKEKEGTERKIVKLLLNTISGLMAKSTISWNIEDLEDIPVKNETNYSLIHIGAMITSWGRYLIITEGKKYGDRWVYTDTDSLHIIGKTDLVLNNELGGWKIEHKAKRAVYFKKKIYILEKEDGYKVTKAGADKQSTENLETIMELFTEYPDRSDDIRKYCIEKNTIYQDFNASEYIDFLNNCEKLINSKNLIGFKNLKVPVRYKERSGEFEYIEKIRYEQFTNHILDTYIKKSGSQCV